MNFKNSLSYLISSQLPLHIRQDYPQFVTFLEKYYEFLDQSDQANGLLLNAASWSDINETLDMFMSSFGEQYLQMFPSNSLLDQKKLIKFIREFYESKGSEESIKFLFKVFFNEIPTVFYPSNYILKPSDGSWVKDKVIKILQNEYTLGNPFDLIGKYAQIKSIKNVGTVKLTQTHVARVISVSKIAYEKIPTYSLTVDIDEDNSNILLPGSGASTEPLIVDGKIVAVTANPTDNSREFDATVDGVGLSYGIIELPDHGYTTGEVVIYDPEGNEAVGGLIPYRHYYVKVVDNNNIRLYGNKSTLTTVSPRVFFKSSAVNFASNSISIPNHGYITGDLVVYQNAVSPLGGLIHRGTYYVIKIDNNTIKLASSLIDADPSYSTPIYPDENRYFANKLDEAHDDESQPFLQTTLYNEINLTTSTANDYHFITKEFFINFTDYGTGTQRFIKSMDSKGSGYYAIPNVSFYTESGGSGATAKAILDGSGGISHVEVLETGSGYVDEQTTLVQFDTEEIETYVYLPNSPIKYGYVSRVASSVSILGITGTVPYGFKQNEIYKIIESGSVGSYTVIFNNSDLNYFASDYVLIGIDNKASIKIDRVDSDGKPTAISIFDSGRLWGAEYITLSVPSNTGNGTLSIRLTTGAISERAGRPADRKGFLSDVNKLQDNYYYQNYSYVIRSKTSSINWMNLVKETVHPTGMAVFGELLLRNTISFNSTFNVLKAPIHEYVFQDEIVKTGQLYTIDFVKELSEQVVPLETVEISVSKPLQEMPIILMDSNVISVDKSSTDIVVPMETTTFVINKSIVDVVVTTSTMIMVPGITLDGSPANVQDEYSVTFNKTISDAISVSDESSISIEPGPTDTVNTQDILAADVSENTVDLASTVETSIVDYEKIEHMAAVTHDNGVINIQDYWSETYAAAGYVGREYTF